MTEPAFSTEHARVYRGHVLELLREMEDESVDCVVTSPPYYGLRSYDLEPAVWDAIGVDHEHRWTDDPPITFTMPPGSAKQASVRGANGVSGSGSWCDCTAWRGHLGLEPTPDLYIEHLVWIFAQVHRILRPTGTLWLNLGDSYSTWGQNGSIGKRSTLNGSQKAQTAAARMPAKRGEGIKPKDLIGIPWMAAFALRSFGYYLRSDIIWDKPNAMPESITDRPTNSHEYLFFFSKSPRYYYDRHAILEDFASSPSDMRKMAEQRDRIGGRTLDLADPLNKANASTNIGRKRGVGRLEDGGRNARSVWRIPTTPYPEAHFATFPEELARRPILASTKPGGVVLDPFTGSGTTLAVAVLEGRIGIGCELGAKYVRLAQRRIAAAEMERSRADTHDLSQPIHAEPVEDLGPLWAGVS